MDAANKQLATAFEAFNDLSTKLAGAYEELERQVERLTRELAEARSERLRQLAEKERLAHRLARLVETLPGGVLVLDRAGVILDANRGAQILLGEPLLGEGWDDVSRRCFTASESSGEAALHDGRKLSISFSELDEEGAAIVLLQDVSEMHRLQEQLHRDRRLAAMGEMTASLAHQIRTPLASALLYASQLDNPMITPAQHGRFTGKLLGRLRYLENTVHDMLVFASGGAPGMEEVGSADLLNEFRQLIEPQLVAHSARLRVQAETEGRLRCNPEALLGALENLAVNAMQAQGHGARLHLSLKTGADAMLELRLRDDGPGIPDTLRERIFEPFFTTRGEGTGLGLAVVREIARGHGGEVFLEAGSREGSCFVIRLPWLGESRNAGNTVSSLTEKAGARFPRVPELEPEVMI